MTTNSNELHVIFGTGPLGRSVAASLVRRNLRVRMVNRSGKAVELPEGVEIISADAYDPASVKKVTTGAAVVYQCAQPGYTEWAEKFPGLQNGILEGTAANAAVSANNVEQRIHADSSAALRRASLETGR